MRYIPFSNSFHKINFKKEIHPVKVIRIILYLILALLFCGLVYKFVDTKIMDAKIKAKTKFVRIDGAKYNYDVYGSGDYTLILDGDLGYDMSQWSNVLKGLEDGFDGNIFIYDRAGYGFNDASSADSIEDQAKNLKMVMKRAGVSGPYILVGQGYGSLVMTNFAKLYPENIGGMILIDPINEKLLGNEVSNKQYNKEILKYKFLKYSSYFGITNLLDKFNLIKNDNNYLSGLNSYDKEEFSYHKLNSTYNGAYLNELKNLTKAQNTTEVEGLINDKPLALIINKDKDVKAQSELSKLSKTPLVDSKTIDGHGKVLSQSNSSSIVDEIKAVTKKYKQIKKSQTQNSN